MAINVNNKSLQPQQTSLKKGSGFTNLQSVLNANKGNRLGQTISGGVSNAINTGKQTLGQADTEFQQAATKNTVGTEADKETIRTGIGAANAGSVDDQMANRFEQYRAGYQGPAGYSQQQQQNLGNQKQDVQDITKGIGSQQGQRGLLQRFVGQPQYSAGQQRLDSLLLGQSANPELRSAKREGKQFLSSAQLAEQNAINRGTTLKNEGEAFKQDISKQLGQAGTGLQTTVQGREQQQEGAARNAMDTVQRALRGENISQEQFDAATSILDEGTLSGQTYGALTDIGNNNVDITDKSKIDFDTNDFATQEDLSSYNALKKLSGSDTEALGNFQLSKSDRKFDPSAFLDKKYLADVSANKKAEYQKSTEPLAKILRDQELVAQNIKGAAGDAGTRAALMDAIRRGGLPGISSAKGGQIDKLGAEDLTELTNSFMRNQAAGGADVQGNVDLSGRAYLNKFGERLANTSTGLGGRAGSEALTAEEEQSFGSDLDKALAGIGNRRQEIAGISADKLAQIKRTYGDDYGVNLRDPSTYQSSNPETLKSLLQRRIK